MIDKMKRLLIFIILMFSYGVTFAYDFHWQMVDISQFEDYMSVRCIVQIDGEEQFVNSLELAAFCGDECRGTKFAAYLPPTQRYIFQLSVYGNPGETMTFRIYDHIQDCELMLDAPAPVAYTPDILGSLLNPYVVNFTTPAITFLGSQSDHNWSMASNWNTGTLPTAGDNVVINGICELDQDATVASMTVNEGKSIIVKNGKKLTVGNTLNTTSASQLVIEDGGQLVNAGNDVWATVRKIVTGFGTSEDNWYLIASPVTDNAEVTNLTNNAYNLFTFDGSEVLEWRTQHDNPIISHKVGYLYGNQNNTTLEFTGTLAGTTEATALTRAAEGDGTEFPGFNLIGNPYPCNAYIADSYYRMNSAGNGIIPGTGAVAPCEAIFVDAATDGQTVAFSKTPIATSYASLTVSNGNGAVADRVIVRFDGNHNLEKFMFNEGCTKLYALQGSKDYAVVSASSPSGEMPINFKAVKQGAYTISFDMENVSADYMHLIDNMTGADVDLLAIASTCSAGYTFEAKPSDYASRFKLVFSATGIDENVVSTGSANFAYISNGNLVIDKIEGEATLQIIDMTGRILSNEKVSGSFCKALNFRAGVYVVKLNDMTQKMVVK